MSIKSCSVCQKFENLRVCSGCKETHYCSTECQRVGWATHKHVCLRLKMEHEGKKGQKILAKGASYARLTQDVIDNINLSEGNISKQEAAAMAALGKGQIKHIGKSIRSLKNIIKKMENASQTRS